MTFANAHSAKKVTRTGLKLFLSSQAISKDQAPYLIKLVGKSATAIKLALIENAADVEQGPKPWLTRNREWITSHAFDVELLDLNEFRGKLAELKKKLTTKDVVWFGGGNTYYLRWLLRETGADQILQELLNHGLVYGGGSAGAIVAGPTLKHFEVADDITEAPEILLSGLGLTQTVVLPHSDNRKYAPIMQSLKQKLEAEGYKTSLLTDSQALVVDGDEQKVV